MKIKKLLAGIGVFTIMTVVGCSGGSNEGNKDKEVHNTSQQGDEELSAEDIEASCITEGLEKEDIVVLFTTDVHHKIDDYIGYEGAKNCKEKIVNVCGKDNVALVDCGDNLDGGELGDSTSGSAIIEIMNETGYDVATPGNHDFKYSVENSKRLAKMANFDYISCNLRKKDTKQSVLEPYTILEKGGKKIAFIGVTTCQNPFSYEGCNDFRTPCISDIVNENYQYDFWENGLYERVQTMIDEVRGKGAEYVILLTHLGFDSSEFSSSDLVKNTAGADAVIDGHAHLEVPMESVTDAAGNVVPVTAAGEHLINIGRLVIKENGDISSKLIHVSDYVETIEKDT